MRYTFKKSERLKSRKAIGALFTEGKVINAHPVKLFWLPHVLHPESANFQFGCSVSKKKFKLAVDRNRVKRLLREAIRLHKNQLLMEEKNTGKQFAIMLLYVGNELPTFELVESKVINCFERFKNRIT